MTITLTLGEISERYDWKKFCEVTGTNYWCLNEGLAVREQEVSLTLEQAKEIGISLED